ncbi:type IV secretion system DNA-binding domain-containing protein [Curtobacterium sp. MCSS17_007]|uniref:type IV secretory system conjugative DNA transfer family protein n=1 Tax=Curtobacterium sp. MCSS17_007 TaxID=2175646 RepID=UPI000DA8BF46|nr:type IV secretion system DNA-binding domain-containing protein [Curtobacterium sp. MCSS17_007]WIE74468.1 type IV secretion system DNA-binding domain-containing protein [Curtobacterium sp. MCSS17_007]
MRFKRQTKRDANRDVYLVTFPTDLAAERVLAWLRSVSGTLPKRTNRFLDWSTLAFETWASARGIAHRVHVPKSASEYVASQLRTLAPGITVTKDATRPGEDWTAGLELGMTSPTRQLRIMSHNDLSASVLASVQSLGSDEAVMIQWVLGAARPEILPARDGNSRSAEFSMKALITSGVLTAQNDELNDRRQKLEEPNLLGVGRVVVKANNPRRAGELILRVESSLAGANSPANRFRRTAAKSARVIADAKDAATPLLFPGQFNLKELAAVISWPIGQPFVAGLPQGSTRHLYANEDIATEGIVIGDSNYPGHERPIALTFEKAVQHVYYGGKTGTGKTVAMANNFGQVVKNGYGAIVIDASNSNSSETMFSRALNLIPSDRLDDVIIMNPSEDGDMPVGFNVLDQGRPRVVADQIKDLFAHLYQDTAGVWTKQLLFHGLYTLAEHDGMTISELMPLINPQTKEEVAWADELRRGVRDKELRNFWNRWENFNQSERDRNTQPLINRMWQLDARPELRGMLGQAKSSFKVQEVLRDNKILLISLNGLPPGTASILGTLIVNAVWSGAQTMSPDRPNFLYLDEFQVMTRLPTGLDDMLNRSRKHGLGVVMGTQYLEDVPAELKNAITNNARSRVIFQSSAKEARMWSSEFGRTLDENDFMRIRQYEAVAEIATESGVTAPVTLKARPPLTPTGQARAVRELSRKTYGRPIGEVEDDMENRRQATVKAVKSRPMIGIRAWDDEPINGRRTR